MNYSQIIKAMPALGEVEKLRLPYPIARDIHRILQTFAAEYQFFAQEEAKLINELGAKDENGNPQIADGRITFESVEAKNKYNERITELGETDANVEIPCVTLTAAELGDERISANTIEALDGIINFE